MNTALQSYQFNEHAITLVDHNGDRWMTGEDIGNALGYTNPRDQISKIYERNKSELDGYSVTVKLTATDGKLYDTRVYNEEGVIIITFLSKQPKAVAFRRWAAAVLKSLRHAGQPAINPAHLAALQGELLKANPRLQDVLNLTRLGYSQARIGEMLGLGPTAIYNAAKRLRECGFVVCAESALSKQAVQHVSRV